MTDELVSHFYPGGPARCQGRLASGKQCNAYTAAQSGRGTHEHLCNRHAAALDQKTPAKPLDTHPDF